MEKRVQWAFGFLGFLLPCPTASQATATTSFTGLYVFSQQCVVGRAHAQSRRHSSLISPFLRSDSRTTSGVMYVRAA